MTEGRVVLPDGRTLAYAEFGRPDGAPVLWFHGAPSSRLEPLFVGDARLAALGLRVIAPDRPGMGGSTFQRGRRFGDWPADVVALADALGLPRFAVLGNSGGAGYVLACAARIPGRLTAAVIVSGGCPMHWPEARRGLPFVNRLVLTLARRAPLLLRALFASMGGVAEGDRAKELAEAKQRMPAADFAAIAEPGRLEAFAQSMREAMRQGPQGAVHDLGVCVRAPEFRLDEVRIPVALFHGEQDANAPIALARRVAATLPAARLTTYPDEAHLSTLCNRFAEIAAALA